MGEENRIAKDCDRSKISFVYHYFILFLNHVTEFIFSVSQHSSKTKCFSIIPYLDKWYHHSSNCRIRNLDVIFHISLFNIPILLYLKFYQFYPLSPFQKHLFLFTRSTTTLVQAVMNSLLTTAKASFTQEIFAKHLLYI